MNSRLLLIVFTIITAYTIASSQQLLWDNGSWDGSSNWASMRHTDYPLISTVVDDARFNTDVRITALSWDSIFRPANSNPFFADVEILTSTFANLYDFRDLSYSKERVGTDRGLPVYKVTVSNLDIVLPKGRYYFGGRMVEIASGGAYAELQSGENFGETEAYFQSDFFGYPDWTPASSYFGSRKDLAFRLYGEPVPEPATLFVLGTAFGMLRLRKRR